MKCLGHAKGQLGKTKRQKERASLRCCGDWLLSSKKFQLIFGDFHIGIAWCICLISHHNIYHGKCMSFTIINTNSNKYLYSALSCVIQSAVKQNEWNTTDKRKEMIEFEVKKQTAYCTKIYHSKCTNSWRIYLFVYN